MIPDKILKLMDDRHFDLFAEFTKYEILSGGPDPHVNLVGEMAKDCDFNEKLWRGGCYISAYNVASAEVFWQHWPWPRIMEEPMLPWLEQNWKGITTRTERKGVRIPANMETYFLTYSEWMLHVLNGDSALTKPGLTPKERYYKVWDETQTMIKFFGRYVGIKLLEYFRRHCGIDLEAPDIRPEGAWSPRTTLTLLYPDRAGWLLGNDSKENIAVVNNTANELAATLLNEYDVRVDMFQLEVVLCNYRQAYAGRKLYPGRTHDTEVRYFDTITPHWGNRQTDFWRARSAAFPHEHLGELNGWRKVRNELGYLTKEGFIWSDLKYDYSKTVDLNQPVRRENADVLKAAEIVPGKLYQRGVFHDNDLEKKVEFLNSIGVDTVINLWHTADLELIENTDVIYHHHYFPDSNVSLDVSWLLDFGAEMADHIRAGHSALVHCFGGRNRSGLVLALIYRELFNVTGQEAMEHIKRCKANALKNEFYCDFLRRLPVP